jgi:hypothetical protein
MTLVDGKLVIRRTAVPVIENVASSSQMSANVLTDFTEATSTEGVASSTSSVAIATSTESDEGEMVISFDTLGNAFFAGEVVAQKVTTGGLSVSGVATFSGGLEVSQLGSASSTLSILSDTTFFGRPYFTSDTGGTALIKKGARFVDIVFDREYVAAPIMSASVAYATTTDDSDIEALLADDVWFVVTKRDAKGFTIRLSKVAPADMSFNWIALAVTDAKEFTSKTPAPEATPQTPVADESPTDIPGGTSTTTEQVVVEDAGGVPMSDVDSADEDVVPDTDTPLDLSATPTDSPATL